MRERYPPDPHGSTGAAHVIRSGEPQLFAHVSDEQLVAGARDAEHLELVRSLDLTSALIVPLRAREHVLGAITLVRTGERPGYTEDDVAFVGRGRRARRAGGRQRAPVRRGARPGARLGRGAGAARRARHRGAHRPGLPRHRLPLRARQRCAGRDQRRAGDRSHRPHRARGAARDGARDRGRRSRRCWPPARRSSTCTSSARHRASPVVPATTWPATTRSRSRAASAWASASPSPT